MSTVMMIIPINMRSVVEQKTEWHVVHKETQRQRKHNPTTIPEACGQMCKLFGFWQALLIGTRVCMLAD